MATRGPTLSPSIGLLMGKLCAIIPFYRMAVSQTCRGWRVATPCDYICILWKAVWEGEGQLCLKRRSLAIHENVKGASSLINKWVLGFHSSELCQHATNGNFIRGNIRWDFGKDSDSQHSAQERLFPEPRLLQRDAIVLCVISSVRRRAASSCVLPRSRWCGRSF